MTPVPITRDMEISRQSTCKHERKTVYDFESTDSDTVLYHFKCRECGYRWQEEAIGSLTRSVGFSPEESL